MQLGGYIQALARGLDVVEQCAGVTRAQLIEMGARPDFAEKLLGLHAVYFGDTMFRSRQRKARRTGHDVFTLLDIERYCSKLKARKAWELRQLLAATPREKIPMVAKAKLKEWRPPKDPAPGVRVTRRAGRNHTLSITDSSLNISKLLAVLKTTDKDLLTAAHTVFRGGGGSGQKLQSNVIVRLDELDRIVDGDGEEIELQLTNGATMTGAEFVREKLADVGLITLVHPHHGPVNLYMASRFANTKQRLALSAEHPTCAWPGCNAPADDSQIHHLTRFQDGGPTNMANLVPLCAYHNAVNDDDPEKPTGRGHLDRIDGRVHYLPPWAGPPIPIESPAHPPRSAPGRAPGTARASSYPPTSGPPDPRSGPADGSSPGAPPHNSGEPPDPPPSS
ncbi:HNH endonuclease [Corynebacterium hesseae]|uniref:HNH endonuclease n=1 Tax=Corynebacterium hesseae TaxID=2913502 RepID=UPI0022BA05A5|nr:HNH endonuclease [Corynebacterium hesseae]MCZ9298178.1 HNH endonuclease [Corynebacterium hesseae]